MLAHEWRELEVLCERIAMLRERLAVACRTANTGLIEGITADMDRAVRQRERLVRHISTRLGAAAADPARPDPPGAVPGPASSRVPG